MYKQYVVIDPIDAFSSLCFFFKIFPIYIKQIKNKYMYLA